MSKMQRVVITGLGVVSSLGCSTDAVCQSLHNGNSGLTSAPDWLEYGLRCGVYALVRDWDPKRVPRRSRQTMGHFATYAAAATLDALQDAQLNLQNLTSTDRVGVIVGSSFAGVDEISRLNQFLKANKKSRAGAVGVVKMMNSSASGNIASMLGLRGRSYSISSSFAAGLDNIGHGYELIKHGMLDVAICGAAEEDCGRQRGPSMDRWDAFATRYNDDPESACRPYDAKRDGIVMSAGSGILILESFEHAQQRDAHIYSEFIGYGAANDGSDMFRPNGDGLQRAISSAMSDAELNDGSTIEYVNTHGTGTAVGDEIEVEVLRGTIGDNSLISSTKGLAGHSLSACGALEAVYTLLMMEHKFIAPTCNLDNIAPECLGVKHVQDLVETDIATSMCINMGLGGTNSAVLFQNSYIN